MKNKILFILILSSFINNIFSMDCFKVLFRRRLTSSILPRLKQELKWLYQQQKELETLSESLTAGVFNLLDNKDKIRNYKKRYADLLHVEKNKIIIARKNVEFSIVQEDNVRNFRVADFNVCKNKILAEFSIDIRIYQSDYLDFIYAHIVNIFDRLLLTLDANSPTTFVKALRVHGDIPNNIPDNFPSILIPKKIEEPQSLEEALTRLLDLIETLSEKIKAHKGEIKSLIK